MRALIQRVNWANVTTVGAEMGAIHTGLVIFLGIKTGDVTQDVEEMAAKIATLRLFEDEQGKTNWDLSQVGGSVLVVSQFTLYADCRKGRRPAFTEAMEPKGAQSLYDFFILCLRKNGVKVETGQFQAHMVVSLQNDGPFTLLLEIP